jgi:hypothetical protein
MKLKLPVGGSNEKNLSILIKKFLTFDHQPLPNSPFTTVNFSQSDLLLAHVAAPAADYFSPLQLIIVWGVLASTKPINSCLDAAHMPTNLSRHAGIRLHLLRASKI